MKFIASLLLSALAACSVEAATRIAVLEFGAGGSVRRTTASNIDTSVEGVASFWKALHQQNRRSLQHAGMPVVPDLFKKADSGVVIGLSGSGLDLDDMPFVSGLVSNEGNDVVGHLEVSGSRLESLMSKVSDVETVSYSDLLVSAKTQSEKRGLCGCKTSVDSSNAAAVDGKMSEVMTQLKDMAESSGKTIVVHVVVEEEVASARRRLLSRRLDENDGQNQNNGDNNNGDANANQNGNSAFYGYGYYNQYGQWVTPYKTMFQIQYFNIVLWTSVGLVVTIFFVIYLMVNMPLEPDTLLFGESGRLPGED